MALAVKDKDAAQAAEPSPFDRLAVSSLIGLAYVLGTIGVVFYLIPGIWRTLFAETEIINSFVTATLQILLMLGSGSGLCWLGGRLVGFDPPHGMRGGVFLAGAGLTVIALITWLSGRLFESLCGRWEIPELVGLCLTLGVSLALLWVAGRRFFRPGAEALMTAVEDQGWFSLAPYKKNQGMRVRRCTTLGVLVLTFSGIWVLMSHRTLEFEPNSWELVVPFNGGQTLRLLSDVRFTVPMILAALSLWLGYRIVNWPTFADFLIATEAEMNKVSWTTRKRLVQDTMVVLATVILMTVFLFVVDILWGFLLSQVGVLQTQDDAATQQARPEQQPW
jgi:preprotein translocase SecE subunit